MKIYSERRLGDDGEERPRGSRRLSIRADPKSRDAWCGSHTVHREYGRLRMENRGSSSGTTPQGMLMVSPVSTSASFHYPSPNLRYIPTQHHLVAVSLPSYEPFTSARSVAAADQPTTPPQLSNHLRFKHCHKRRNSGTLGNCLAEPR